MKRTNKTTKRAFTLIELLIVIAIIGILFVVLVSKVDFATDKAKASGVQTDFRSFQVAFETVSKENAGFASLGWDTGDDNGNRKRDSYDEGDTNKNNIMESTETWTGHKVYGEDWTGTYTLINPDDDTDKSAFKLLEDKVNANLDPKLHITITPEENAGVLTGNAKVTMANAAKDPWKNEYHGVYLTNAQNDKGDRGAFIIYSNGANGQWGSEHSIANGNVSIIVPGNNVRGKDDYAMTVFYTYINGYGEVAVATFGFSNNQQFLGGSPNGNLNIGNNNNGGSNSNGNFTPTPIDAGATFSKYLVSPGCHSNPWRHERSCFMEEDTTLTWDELRLPENGVKYGYNSSAISDTAIGTSAFEDCVTITNINIPSNIVSIGDSAFSDCAVLQSVYVPDSVIEFGSRIFYNCVQMTSVRLPDSMTVLPELIFCCCSSLKELDFPNSLITIEESAFEVAGLVKAVLPDGVKTIADCAFNSCEMLEEVELPSNLETIGEGAFTWCPKLKKITIPKSIIVLGEDVFSACYGLKEVVFESGCSIESIPSYAFSECYELESINIPDSVKTIERSAFYECYVLREVHLPKSIEDINSWAFAYCSKLLSVTIPQECTDIYIAYDAFEECRSLLEIVNYSNINNEEFSSIHNGTLDHLLSTVVLNDNSRLEYQGDFVFCGPFLVDYLGDSVNVTLPASYNGDSYFVTAYSFAYNKTISNVVINTNCLTVDNYAFYSAENLETVTVLGNKCCSIGSYAFAYCPKLKTVTVEEGLKTIASNAFNNSCSLRKISVPLSVEQIGTNAFRQCTNVVLYYAGTEEQWNSIEKASGWDNSIVGVIYTNGSSCYNHVGGTATCLSAANCEICGEKYGYLGAHTGNGNTCTTCGVEMTIIESPHNPYINNIEREILGKWNYEGATSVRITIQYEMESTSGEYFQVRSQENGVYLNKNGTVSSTSSSWSYYGNNGIETVTFETVDMLFGELVWRTDGTMCEYYGVKIIISPNYD